MNSITTWHPNALPLIFRQYKDWTKPYMIRLYLPSNNAYFPAFFISKMRFSFVKIFISMDVSCAFIPAETFFLSRVGTPNDVHVEHTDSLHRFGKSCNRNEFKCCDNQSASASVSPSLIAAA
jgi:hypothetical protein